MGISAAGVRESGAKSTCYYPDNAAAIAASKNLLEETDEQTAEIIKVNTDIRKMLWLTVYYKGF